MCVCVCVCERETGREKHGSYTLAALCEYKVLPVYEVLRRQENIIDCLWFSLVGEKA